MLVPAGSAEHARVDDFILASPLVALTVGTMAVLTKFALDVASLPRPGDATVATAFTIMDRDWPSSGEAGVTVVVANPGLAPVLVGLSLRRRLLPGGRLRRRVPRRTSRRRYQPTRQAAIAAFSAGAIGELSVPVPDSRRYRLVIVIGQQDGRLCVHSAPLRVAPGGGRPRRPTRGWSALPIH
jgi:hypothetical protein